MSENLRRYHAALYGMNAVVVRVDPARWDDPSKCTDWACREVLGHVIWLTRNLAASAGVGERPPQQPEAEVAGPDPLASWVEARNRVLVALDREGALRRESEGPFGTWTVDQALRLAASDTYTHTWDIAAALEMDAALDPAIAAEILPGLQAAGDGLRAPGLMGPEVVLEEGADIVSRYLAYSGRDPR